MVSNPQEKFRNQNERNFYEFWGAVLSFKQVKIETESSHLYAMFWWRLTWIIIDFYKIVDVLSSVLCS